MNKLKNIFNRQNNRISDSYNINNESIYRMTDFIFEYEIETLKDLKGYAEDRKGNPELYRIQTRDPNFVKQYNKLKTNINRKESLGYNATANVSLKELIYYISKGYLK